jgi:RimJ/RimL family protein N-acetyltransferase
MVKWATIPDLNTRGIGLMLKTSRLILRRWKDSDLQPFAAMNADPIVMEHFPKTSTLEETKSMIERIETRFSENGFGLWAAEIISTQEFIGFVGLQRPTFEAPFMPCVEIGWRLAKQFWGQGYAPEAASGVLQDGFERILLDEIVSMTTTTNLNSMRVMQKIGMKTNPKENFQHPLVEDGHRLQEHVLYRISKEQWSRSRETRSV